MLSIQTKSESILEAIARVEKNDDLYPSSVDSYVGGIVGRVIPNRFYIYLKGSVKVIVRQDYDQMLLNKMVYHISVNYQYWTDQETLDLTNYKTDKATFGKILEDFVERASQRLIKEKNSGNPWWKDQFSHYSFQAVCLRSETDYLPWICNLAKIKKRGNKYQWFLLPYVSHYLYGMRSDWNNKEHKQGTTNTLEEAKSIVESVWKQNH